MARDPNYKPYRTPTPSKARGPILSPEHITTYTHSIDHTSQQGEASLLSLAATSARLLGTLSMPQSVHLRFPVQDITSIHLRADAEKGTLVIRDDEDLYIKATQRTSDEYAFQTRIPSSYDIIDRADYTIRRAQYEGFVMPWGIQCDEVSRTFYPQMRASSVDTSAALSPTAPLNKIRGAMIDIINGSANYVFEQIEPPLE